MPLKKERDEERERSPRQPDFDS